MASLKPVITLCLFLSLLQDPGLASASERQNPRTRTPIKHLIVVVGENVSFDTLFGTYQPRKGQTIHNLLSEGVIHADGSPGPQYAKTLQNRARNDSGLYTLDPERAAPFEKLPQPTLIGAYDPETLSPYGPLPDPRFQHLSAPGPFQITRYADYPSGLGDPAHRFFQMWQQTGGDNKRLDLYTWVAVTAGSGGATTGVEPEATGQGGELMGFFNMNTGDAPYFKQLASDWVLSDNYHQSIMGGTGANFFAIATGDVAVYNHFNQLATPPSNQIENPNPLAGTQNFYLNDGESGGTYVNCFDEAQPGVAPILQVLQKNHRESRCEPGAYYLVNNYVPPYSFDGIPQIPGSASPVLPPQYVPTIGELLTQHGIRWRWYTGGRDNEDILEDPLYQDTIYPKAYAEVKKGLPQGTPDSLITLIATREAIQAGRTYFYNRLGDPLNDAFQVNLNPMLHANLKGLQSFRKDVTEGELPEVSFVVPKNMASGHPGYSTPSRFEAFLMDLIPQVQASKNWSDTAIVITTDEGGGYFDTGAIQQIDFFGDGPRIPLIVVSPFAKRGVVDHTYQDHASILKFIEYNWHLPRLSARSRDQLPNPKGKGYLPANAPAVGDLRTLFDFRSKPKALRSDHRVEALDQSLKLLNWRGSPKSP